MAYPHHFEKFGPQAKSLAHPSIYYRPEWTNVNRYTRTARRWFVSLAGSLLWLYQLTLI